MKILITGTTGTVGSELYRNLSAGEVSFVGGVRDIAKASEKLKSEKNLVRFDFTDPSSFEGATEGVDRVFLIGPPMVMELDQLFKPFLQFLKEKGINKIVYMGAMGLDKVPSMPIHTNAIQLLSDMGFTYSVIRPTFFAQNFKNYEGDNIERFGIVYASGGDGKVSFIDARDIASSAAAVLTSDEKWGISVDITGSALYSYSDAADLLSNILGKKISSPNPTPEEYKNTLIQAGAPAFVGDYMNEVYGMIRAGYTNVVTNGVKELTGKDPIPFEESLRYIFN